MIKNVRYRTILLFLALPLILGACKRNGESRFKELDQIKTEQVNHLDMIQQSGVLKVVTEYNSISYFIYRGQPLGFQYEMLQELANYLDLSLEVSVSNDLSLNFSDLREGQVDLIAMNLTITSERKTEVSFTEPLLRTRQVLVQRKPERWRQMNVRQREEAMIRSQLDLAGKVVYVQDGSVYEDRLRSLSNEIGGGIEIREVNLESEQLIQRVALGEIDFTVCDENVGLVNTTYFPQLDVATAISFQQHVAWAVNQRSDSLRLEIDKWVSEYKKSRGYAILYNKYFKNRHEYRNIHSEDYALGSGKISPYDEFIKRESERIGWDWRLLASLVYQESRFNPEAVSWAGAFGLMQMMPATAKSYGVTMDSSPEVQIRAGASFIKWLDDRFVDVITDKDERIKFILGSYNIGLGHIQDARRLAERYDDDPDVWFDNVEKWLLKKSDPIYYHDQVVRHGYARGIETYNFVRDITERFEDYRNILNSDVIAIWKPIEELHLTSSQ
jgi:membrane-bound lytic murein transglycosylase F